MEQASQLQIVIHKCYTIRDIIVTPNGPTNTQIEGPVYKTTSFCLTICVLNHVLSQYYVNICFVLPS